MDLVPDRWYLILTPDQVPRGRPVRHRRLGADHVFWRDAGGRLHAALDRCPHRGAALSIGAVEGDALVCPYHGFRFAPSGACTAIPAHPSMRIPSRMRLRRVAVAEAHGFVWMFSGDPDDAPDAVPFFDGLDRLAHRGSDLRKTWPTHYARVVENELDWAHLPFVHRTTIGIGYDPDLDDEVEVTQDGDRITTWLRRMGDRSRIDFLGPNVWRMHFSPVSYNFLGFAPVDDEHVVLYVRSYQGHVRLWPFDRLLAAVQRLANPVVLAQDARTVPSQRPKIPRLDGEDVFVPSDKPVLAYLRWRRAAKAEGAERARRRAEGSDGGDPA